MAMFQKPEEQIRGGLLGLFDRSIRPNQSSGLNPLQRGAAALDALIMPELRGGQSIRQQGAARAADMSRNKTVETLRAQGRDDLAQAVLDGTIGGKEAFGVMQSEAAADKAFQREKDLAAYQAGLRGTAAPKTYEFQAKAQALMNANPNLSSQEALNMVLSKGPAPQKTPTSIQEYQYAVANNQLPEGVSTFPEYEEFMARAGRNVPDQTMHPTLNRPLTVFELEKDKKYADLLPDLTLSGISTAARNAATIKTVIEQLGNPKEGQDLTGPYQGMLGTLGRNIFAEESQEAFNNVASVLQQSLREILGGQFAEKEGAALIARGYDIYAPPEVNAARLRALYTQLEATAANKAKLMEYTNTYGTTAGFGGSASQPDVQDFYSAMSQAEKGLGFNPPKSTGANNVEQYRLNPQTGKVERVNAD
tara:strand:- start:2800 stop:4062 length:1263 start_codon:yes stop_codon:yes gene_type:complete